MQKNQDILDDLVDLVEIKNKDIQKIRDDILLAQEGRCALCGNKITKKTGV
jgi:5-methylcytosine-specific restriction endonuclease McrA